MKHVPLRSCIVCRQQKEKSELLRIVRKPNGEIVFDEYGRESGRGAYICKSGECMDNAIKKRALNRVYKQQLPDDVYEQLKKAYGKLDAEK